MVSPEYRSVEIDSGRTVPIEFVFSPHGDEFVGNVAFFEGRARDALARYPAGKLLLVTENAQGTAMNLVMLQMAIEGGRKPSVAAATIDTLSMKDHLPSHDLWATPEETTDYLQRQPKHIQSQFGAMDKLTQEYPGRTLWLVEGGTYEAANEIGKMEAKSYEDTKQSYLLVADGDFSKAVPLFKEGVNIAARCSHLREQRLVNAIHRTIQTFPEIVGVIGQFGTSHTPIIHKLTRMGYPTKMHFSDKEVLPYTENKGYIFNPRDALERQLVMFPSTYLSGQEYLKFLIGSLFYSILVSSLTVDSEDTNQDFAFYSWGLVNQLSTGEDIEKLQRLVQRENDFLAAVEIFITGNDEE